MFLLPCVKLYNHTLTRGSLSCLDKEEYVILTMCRLLLSPGLNSVSVFLTVSVSSMGQHLGKKESPMDSEVRVFTELVAL